jgi:hypothetical protein
MFHFVCKCTISEFCIAMLTTLGELPTTAQGEQKECNQCRGDLHGAWWFPSKFGMMRSEIVRGCGARWVRVEEERCSRIASLSCQWAQWNGDFCLFLAIFVEHAHRINLCSHRTCICFIESRKRTRYSNRLDAVELSRFCQTTSLVCHETMRALKAVKNLIRRWFNQAILLLFWISQRLGLRRLTSILNLEIMGHAGTCGLTLPSASLPPQTLADNRTCRQIKGPTPPAMKPMWVEVKTWNYINDVGASTAPSTALAQLRPRFQFASCCKKSWVNTKLLEIPQIEGGWSHGYIQMLISGWRANLAAAKLISDEELTRHGCLL